MTPRRRGENARCFFPPEESALAERGSIVAICPTGGLEKQSLQGRVRSSLCQQPRPGFFCARGNLPQQLWRRILQDDLGLILDRKQLLDRTLPHQDSAGENANAVANFLHLTE